MIGGGVFLATYGAFGGGAFGDLFNSWAQSGVFSHLIPFLIIFAIVLAVLEKSDLFSNKAVKLIIAVSVGLLAVSQFDVVPLYFSLIFPKLGVALAFILVALALIQAFVPAGDNKVKYVLMGIGLVSLVVIIFTTFVEAGNPFLYSVWDFILQYWGRIVIAIIILGFVIYYIVSGGDKDNNKPR